MISLICAISNLTQTNLCMKQTHRHRKQTSDYQRGNVRGRDKLASWEEHIHTTIYKTVNQQGHTV